MKKLLSLIGLLVIVMALSAMPEKIDFDTGIYIEQPQDFVIVDNIDVTVLNVDFVIVTPKLEGWTDDYSLNSNRYEYLFYEADAAFNYEFYEQENYLRRKIKRLNRPPNMEANVRSTTNSFLTTVNNDGYTDMHKNIFGFWIC